MKALTGEILNHLEYHQNSIVLNGKKVKIADFKNLDAMADQIANVLYFKFYANPPKRSQIDIAKGQTALDELKKIADKSEDLVDAFWMVKEVEKNQFTITKNDSEIIVSEPEITSMNRYKYQVEKGDFVLFHRKIEFYNNHFQFMLGNIPFSPEGKYIVRFYFPVEPFDVNSLKNRLSSFLNQWSIPFSFKFLNQAIAYTKRSDRFVLYVNQKYTDFLVNEFYKLFKFEEAISNNIQPLFTCKLGNGISFGESPIEKKHSFGTLRCDTLARYIILGLKDGINRSKMPDYLLEGLQDFGFDIDKMYKNPLSHFPYEFE